MRPAINQLDVELRGFDPGNVWGNEEHRRFRTVDPDKTRRLIERTPDFEIDVQQTFGAATGQEGVEHGRGQRSFSHECIALYQ